MTESEAARRGPTLPLIIQGGMGVYVSNHNLVREFSKAGERLGYPVMGTVSGTGIGHVVSRILQHGDPGGYYRPAFEAFPFQEMAERVWTKYYIEGGKAADKPYKLPPMVNLRSSKDVIELIICANYAEVWLAKQGHNQPVAINYLEKIQTPHLAELFGAMLAGVDVVAMGAGIPDQVPGVLDALSRLETARYWLDADSRRSSKHATIFNPLDFIPIKYLEHLKRPDFYAIISSDLLAKILTSRRVTGLVNGFIVENHTAGGHNAPPRVNLGLNGEGEYIYGARDEVNLEEMVKLRRPFWLAGSRASPKGIEEAIAAGATGIQGGSIFALANESGLPVPTKQEIIRRALRGDLKVVADPECSPSGFPFNVVQLEGTVSDPDVYRKRERVCKIGYLRQGYTTTSGGLDFRCSAEPVRTFINRGGKPEDTIGKKCLCVHLLGAVGLDEEPSIVTLGRDVSFVPHLATLENPGYSAESALAYLLGK